jgi:uncharacterized protein
MSWEDALDQSSGLDRDFPLFKIRLRESLDSLRQDDPKYFGRWLPSNYLWRLFPDFRHSTAYLDIETNGSAGNRGYVTTIAMYDGQRLYHYVQGQNLHEFQRDVAKYKVLVTYNGKCFDVPFIESRLGIPMNQVHIDLRFLLNGLGYKGGLKGCEKKLGLNRNELDGVNGYFAVLLWRVFRQTRNKKALETLLAYNILDAVNLEYLMVCAYNLKLKETPFQDTHQIPLPEQPENPFQPDIEIIESIMSRLEAHP